MSHKHDVILQKVFAHPLAANLDWKKLAAALTHYGAQIEHTTASKVRIRFGQAELVISLPHHGHELTDKGDITRLKHFLQAQGISG
ncbi:MAG: hypothetical protein JXR44_06725 [Thiotrichales bacterium]|nr:hypothetical protein [Thiotrichales bacterium]